MEDDLKIEYLDNSSGWVHVTTITNGVNQNPSVTNRIVRDLQRSYPNKRMRSIREDGSLFDLYYFYDVV
jgi:hypothetical protein